MKENKFYFAVIQINLGILFILISVGSLIVSSSYSLFLESFCFGVSLLLFGFANNRPRRIGKRQILSIIASLVFFFGAILVIYNNFFQ